MWVLTCLTRLNLPAKIYNQDALRSPVLRQLCSPQVAHQRFATGLEGSAKAGCGWIAWLHCSAQTRVIFTDWCHGSMYPGGMKLLCLHGCHAIQSNPQTQTAYWDLLVITNQNKSSNGDLCKYSSPTKALGCFTEQARQGGCFIKQNLADPKAQLKKDKYWNLLSFVLLMPCKHNFEVMQNNFVSNPQKNPSCGSKVLLLFLWRKSHVLFS